MYSDTHNIHLLTRSSDGYIGGVCGGLAERFGISAFLVRLLWLAAVLPSFASAKGGISMITQ